MTWNLDGPGLRHPDLRISSFLQANLSRDSDAIVYLFIIATSDLLIIFEKSVSGYFALNGSIEQTGRLC